MPIVHDVYTEAGNRRTFAVSVDWPGATGRAVSSYTEGRHLLCGISPFFHTTMRAMKTRTLLLLLFIPVLVLAQEETLLSGEVEHGGFGGPVVKVTRINGQDALLVGGRGGWIINHTFVIGGGGYGLVTDVAPTVPGLFNQNLLMLGYGGLELEFIMQSDRIVHLTVPVLIGAGAVGYRTGHWGDDFDLNIGFDNRFDTFFIIEPGIDLEVNVVSFFRINAGVSYRHVTGISAPTDITGNPRPLTSNNDLRGISWMIGFKFGTF
jgi:hypothetical protein